MEESILILMRYNFIPEFTCKLTKYFGLLYKIIAIQMNIQELNLALIDIILKKNALDTLDYADETYDTIEEELHDLEDDFLATHGDDLEKEITKIHKKLCPKSDVLSPIAYIGKSYYVETKADGNLRFDREPGQGVIVEINGFEDEDTKLLVMPNPLRLILIINDKTQKEVWKA
jgi:hypothetical protein